MSAAWVTLFSITIRISRVDTRKTAGSDGALALTRKEDNMDW